MTLQAHVQSRMARSPQSNATSLRISSEARPERGEECLKHMNLRMLIWHCAAESERFYRGEAHDTRYSFELFRRALVERDDEAWTYIYRHYSSLVERWVCRTSAFHLSGESSDYFVTGAFIKFWQAVTPERFDSFDNLARLLQYLRLCTTSVVIDSVRARAWGEMLPEEAIPASLTLQGSPDEEALDLVACAEFWDLVNTLLNNEAERVIVYDSFILDLTPREIYARRGDVFSSVQEIYTLKRNVLNRLERQPLLRRLGGEGRVRVS